MTRLREKNRLNIAILLAGIAMPFLCAMISCNREKKEVVDIEFNQDSTYTMKATEVITLVSDSGITRYKVVTKEWLMFSEAQEPYWLFPKKVHLEKFDSLFHVEASVDADTAYYYERKELWKLVGHVRVESLQGERFETDVLFLDQDKIYSDCFIRITKGDFVNTGVGFESNRTLTQYKIFNSAAEIPLQEESSDTTSFDVPPT